MIAWFAKNHVAANLLLAVIVLLGLNSLSQKIPLEVFPDLQFDNVRVQVNVRGAQPTDIEQSVTMRIEEAVADLEGIKELNSTSSEGSSVVNIEVDKGYDPQEMLNEVKTRVDALSTLPSDADRPLISVSQMRREVISLAVSGSLSEKEVRSIAEQVRDDVLDIDGITNVDLTGVRRYEIAIEVSSAKLDQYGITLSTVSNAINQSSLDLSAGNLKTEGGEILIRSKGQAYKRQEFEDIVVLTTAEGAIVRIKDIATVIDGFEESDMLTRFNGKTAAFLDVYQVGQQNAIDIAEKVRGYIEAKRPSLPDGIHLDFWRDRSQIVIKRLNTLTYNAIQGGILVLLLLALFLRPSIAFWVFIGIPVSFMGAFIFMPLMGVTLNILSLFAFILVLGIVVDDAIVTGESIYTHYRNGDTGIDAAINGTKSVAVPVTFGILTTVVAFTPMLFIDGARGALFAQIPMVIIPVLLFSLIESKFVLPSHLKHLNFSKKGKETGILSWQRRFADGFERAILKYYQPLLRWCVNYRYFALTLFISVTVIVISLIVAGWFKFTFFPKVSSEVARASLVMPVGTPFEVTDRHVQRIIDVARQMKEDYYDEENEQELILDIMSSTGSMGSASGGNFGRVMFEIVAPEDRIQQMTSQALVQEWRKRIGTIPGAESITYRAEIGRSSDPISIQLKGQDFNTMREVADQLKRQLSTYPAIFDISDSLSKGKQEIQIELKPAAYAVGLRPVEVIRQIRQAFLGDQVQRIQRGRDDVRVIVRYPEGERIAQSDLANLRISTSDGKRIPLGQIANFVAGQSPTTITRTNQFRTVNVVGDVDKESANMLIINQELTEFLDELLVKYPSVKYSLEGEAKEQRESFSSVIWGIGFVLFAIYALLAIPFKSYFQPIMVMCVIPFGMVGAVIGHWIMGMDLTIMSVLGILALLGVVVNDSLVLVDYINQQKSKLQNVKESILNAGAARFRPVILTSLTTFIGLMPLLFEKSTQAQFLIPMAVSLGFGILFATFLTLLLVPVNYMIGEDLKKIPRFLKWLYGSEKNVTA